MGAGEHARSTPPLGLVEATHEGQQPVAGGVDRGRQRHDLSLEALERLLLVVDESLARCGVAPFEPALELLGRKDGVEVEGRDGGEHGGVLQR